MAIKFTCRPLVRRVSVVAHRLENPFHLIYFGGAATGVYSYHVAAAGCLVIGLLAFLPEGD